jgi:hypothetical protein
MDECRMCDSYSEEIRELEAKIERMKQVANNEAHALKGIALGIGNVLPETRRIIEISAAELTALAA